MSLNVSNQSHLLNVIDSSKFGTGVVLTPVVALAAMGVVINLAAFAYLVYTPKIRRPLKVCLFNLVVSDCMFLSGIIIRTAVYWNNKTATSESTACPVSTILILLASPVSYSAVLGLAGYNFIAVYKATQFNTILTTQKAVIITCLSWTTIFIMAILSITLGGRQDPECSLLAKVPPFILILFAVYCLLCSFGMAALNVAVAIKLRSARSVGSSHKARSMPNTVTTKETFYAKNSSQPPDLLSVPRPLFGNDHRHVDDILERSKNTSLVSTTQVRSETLQESIDDYHGSNLLSYQITQAVPSKCLPDIIAHTTKDDGQTNPFNVQSTSSQSTSHEENTETLSVHESVNTPTLKTINSVPAVHYHTRTSAIDSVPGTVRPAVSFELSIELSGKAVSESPRLHQGIVFFSNESKSQNDTRSSDKRISETNTSSGHEEVKDRRLVTSSISKKIRTVMTLTILAFWNAVLTLPILGMWLWLAAVKDVHKEAPYQWVANVLPFLAAFNAVSNPFLYAWRFVNWRRLYITCCKRGTSASHTISSLAQDSRHNSVMTK